MAASEACQAARVGTRGQNTFAGLRAADHHEWYSQVRVNEFGRSGELVSPEVWDGRDAELDRSTVPLVFRDMTGRSTSMVSWATATWTSVGRTVCHESKSSEGSEEWRHGVCVRDKILLLSGTWWSVVGGTSLTCRLRTHLLRWSTLW